MEAEPKKSSEQSEKISSNYFERINKEFEKEVIAGNVKTDTLNQIAKRNKEDFFDVIKDAFENPLEALKYFGTKIFGETIVKWRMEISQSYKNVSDKVEAVNKTAETSYRKVKDLLESTPKKLKSIPIVGGIYKAGDSILDYITKNPDVAKQMPKDGQQEWWKELMVKAGVNPESAEGKGFLSLVLEKKTWDDISKNLKEGLTAENRYKNLSADIESGKFDKEQLFSGEKLGEAGTRIYKQLDKLKDDLITFVKVHPNTVTILSAYLGYNIGLKRNGFRLAADIGKVLVKLAASPLILAKNHKLKVTVLLLGTFLAKDQTKWDEHIALKLKHTRLPKDFAEFQKVLNANPAFKDVKEGLKVAENDFKDAVGIIKSPNLSKSFEELSNLLKPETIVENTVDFLGNHPKESIITSNKRGFYGIQSYLTNSKPIKEALGEKHYENLLKDISDLQEPIKNDAQWLKGIEFSKLEEINKKYGDKASFKFEKYAGYIRYIEFDKKQANLQIRERKIGIDSTALEKDQRIAARRFNFSTEGLENLGEKALYSGAATEGFFRTYKEVLGMSLETPEDVLNETVNKVKNGEAVVMQDGTNMFLVYGKEYILLPWNFARMLGEKVATKGGKDIKPRDIAVAYGEGAALYTIWAGAKGAANLSADGLYKLVTGFDRRIGRVPVKSKKYIAQSVAKAALWPGTMIWRQGAFLKGTFNTIQEVRADGFKNIIKSSAGREMLLSAKNTWSNGSVRMGLLNNTLRKSLGLSEKMSAQTINTLTDFGRIRNAKFHILRQSRHIGEHALTDKRVIADLYKFFQGIEGGEDIWKKIISTADDTKAIDPKDLQRLLSELDKLEVNKKATLDALKKGGETALKGSSYIADGATSLKSTRFSSLKRVGGRLLKNKKTALIGGGLLAAYGLNEYLSSQTDTSENVKIETKKKNIETNEKQKKLKKTAEKILEVQGEFVKEHFSTKRLDELSKLSNKDLKKEINQTCTFYENAHNQIFNMIWQDYDLYEKDGLDGLMKSINSLKKNVSEEKKLPFKQMNLTDTSKWYSINEKPGFHIMEGLISISESDGKEGIEMGWVSRPSLATLLKRKVIDHKANIAMLGASLIPGVSSAQNIKNASDFYEDGNYEEFSRELGYSVSNAAFDVLGIISLGTAKAASTAVKGGKAAKVVETTNKLKEASQAIKHLQKTKGDTAFNAVLGILSLDIGSKIFKDEIDTIKVIKR